jgi:hypothetical protein
MVKGKDFNRPNPKKGERFSVKDEKPAIDYNLKKPTFSLEHMPYRGTCCISRCENQKKALIIDTILRFSQLTWKEIRNLPKQSGFEPIPSYRFKVPLPTIFTPDLTILVARYDGDGGRIAGYRKNDVFHIVLAGNDLYSH